MTPQEHGADRAGTHAGAPVDGGEPWRHLGRPWWGNNVLRVPGTKAGIEEMDVGRGGAKAEVEKQRRSQLQDAELELEPELERVESIETVQRIASYDWVAEGEGTQD